MQKQKALKFTQNGTQLLQCQRETRRFEDLNLTGLWQQYRNHDDDWQSTICKSFYPTPATSRVSPNGLGCHVLLIKTR